MTNREKNKKRFDELGLGGLTASEIARRIAVRKSGDVDLCSLKLCHDCIFECRHCVEEAEKWLTDEAEPDEQAPEKNEEIKAGDTVKVTMKNNMREGATRTVRTINRAKIEKVKSKKTPPSIVVYRDGDTVTVKDLETGETASAVCSKDDTFDLHTGAFIAMSRLTHFDTDIRLMRLEMEQLDIYISDIKMRFGALMGDGYKYNDFDKEEEA